MVEPSSDAALTTDDPAAVKPKNPAPAQVSPSPGCVDDAADAKPEAVTDDSALVPTDITNAPTGPWKVVVNDPRAGKNAQNGVSDIRSAAAAIAAAAAAAAASSSASAPGVPNGPGVPFPTNFNIPTADDDPGGEWIDRTNTPLGEIGNGYELTPRLQTLCLTNNRIKKIEHLEKCPNLRELILRQNTITVVEGLDAVPKLEDLDLYMNAVETVPAESFEANPKLRRVDLSFNQLRALDDFPSKHLENIEELFLIGNKVRRITGLEGMPKLTMLELGDNRIRDIENLESLTSLQGLWLGRNKISEICNLETLTDLRRLSLQSNRITEIQGVATLTQLEELYLSHNGLKSMRGLDMLVNLRVLDLGSNEIEHIEGIETLTELREFWFNGNKLASFDELVALQSAPELETVYLEENPLANDPEYELKVLDMLPELEQLDALLVSDVRRKLEKSAAE